MKKTIIAVLIFSFCNFSTHANVKEQEKTIKIEIKNTWNKTKVNEPIVIQIADLKTGFVIKSAVVMNGTTEIASQLDDLNDDRKADELSFVLDVPAKSTQVVQLILSSKKSDKTYSAKVYAEMLVSDKKG
ncbi:MAG: DUF4861 family protein, partial [Bacteroidaceae bacterium]